MIFSAAPTTVRWWLDSLMHTLAGLLHGTLHWVSPSGRAVLGALAECGGAFGTARFFAARLRFRDRHQLARAIARDGLPPLQELAAWVRMLGWQLQWEQQKTALCQLAMDAGADPAAYYRTCKRLTGANWSQARSRGVAWLLDRLVDRCRVARQHGAARSLRPAPARAGDSPWRFAKREAARR